MAQCSVCGGDTKLMAGVSKKNGKPWSGYKCLNQGCNNMDFQKSNGARPQAQVIKPKPMSNEPEIIKLLLDNCRKLDEIKALLEDLHPTTKIFKGTKPEEEPF